MGGAGGDNFIASTPLDIYDVQQSEGWKQRAVQEELTNSKGRQAMLAQMGGGAGPHEHRKKKKFQEVSTVGTGYSGLARWRPGPLLDSMEQVDEVVFGSDLDRISWKDVYGGALQGAAGQKTTWVLDKVEAIEDNEQLGAPPSVRSSRTRFSAGPAPKPIFDHQGRPLHTSSVPSLHSGKLPHRRLRKEELQRQIDQQKQERRDIVAELRSLQGFPLDGFGKKVVPRPGSWHVPVKYELNGSVTVPKLIAAQCHHQHSVTRHGHNS